MAAEAEGVASDPFTTIGGKNRNPKPCVELYMCEMNIGWLEGFERFSNLKYLWLSRNKLRRVTGIESNFRLQSLYLSHNQLSTLADSAISKLVNLEELIVDHNKLEDLKTHLGVLQRLRRLKTLDLSANPVAEETSYRLHVIKALPWLELLDKQKITDEERNAAKHVKRASFELNNANQGGADASNAMGATAADAVGNNNMNNMNNNTNGRSSRASKTLEEDVDDSVSLQVAKTVMDKIKDRVQKKRILLRPHWAELDRRHLGVVAVEDFESILRRYALWPETMAEVDALLRKYHAAAADATAAGDRKPQRLVNYLDFCVDVEPRGHLGRDGVVAEKNAAKTWRTKVPGVSVCVQIAERQAASIQRRRARKEAQERAAMVQQQQSGSQPAGATQADFATTNPAASKMLASTSHTSLSSFGTSATANSANKPPMRRCHDTFSLFISEPTRSATSLSKAFDPTIYKRSERIPPAQTKLYQL